MQGYGHPLYVKSLSEFGMPIALPQCGGWLLKRLIPGFHYYDAMGCYPIFSCCEWINLHKDLDTLKDELVCLSLVTDPFGHYDFTYLQKCFRDLVIPYKQHYVVDLSIPMSTFVSRHHRRNAQKALKQIQIEKCLDTSHFLNDWIQLYRDLIKKHNIKGITAFSTQVFEKQFRVPGFVAFRASYNNKTIGMLLWYVQDEIGYYHLGAHNALGYELLSSFALFWYSIEYFVTQGLKWLLLGASAGTKENVKNGLTRFKHGWATGTRTAYLCGKIFNRSRYDEILNKKEITQIDYFPAYRKGEFS